MDTIAPPQSALTELRHYIQWVNWTYSQPDKKTGKRSKVPIEPHTGRAASPTDVDAWSGYNAAQTASRKHRDRGIGFVLHGSDPYAVIDLDKVIDLETGEIAPWAIEIVEDLDSYTELSPSGTGLHIWIRGELSGTGKNNKEAGIEVYDRARFITWTDDVFRDEAIKDRQYELNSIVDSLSEPVATRSGIVEEHDKHSVDGNSIADTELLDIARRSSSGNVFKQLYDRGDWTGDKSASEADIKLAGMLAFWTGRDAERMESLMWRSALVRDKWRENRTYISRTISKAIRHCTKVYDPDYREASRKPLEEHIQRLEWFAVAGYHWPGRGGPSDRDVYRALLEVARTYGKLRADSIEVAYSLTEIALAAGVGRVGTVRNALGRLQDKHGFLERVKSGTAREAATYRIELSNDVSGDVSLKASHTINRGNPYVTVSGTSRIRNASPWLETIGKGAALILDYVNTRRGASLDAIAEHKKITYRQAKSKLKNGPIQSLLDVGFIYLEDGVYRTPQDISERIDKWLEDSGHNREARIQAERYRLAREAFHNPKNNTVPTIEELDTQIPETFHPTRVNRSTAPELVIATGELILVADSLTRVTETDLLRHPIDCDCIPCSMPAPNYAKPKMLPGDNPFHTKRRMF